MTAAITLWQPHAELVLRKVKRYETRSWAPPEHLIGERLLLHAAKRRPMPAELAPFDLELDELPRGSIVGSCVVSDALRIGGPYSFSTGSREGDAGDYPGENVIVLHPALSSRAALVIDHAHGGVVDITEQIPFGDWSDGRWAWELTDVADTHARCPRCWARGFDCEPYGHGMGLGCICETCDGNGHCPPVPATGRQRMWQWP